MQWLEDNYVNEMNDILTSMEYGPAPEEASEVRQWLKDHKNKFGHFIGGKWGALASGS